MIGGLLKWIYLASDLFIAKGDIVFPYGVGVGITLLAFTNHSLGSESRLF